MDELLRFAEKANAQRKATAERLLKDRVMTREELIKHGLLSENDVQLNSFHQRFLSTVYAAMVIAFLYSPAN